MARRSFQCSCAVALLATMFFGCAEGATDNTNVPPLDGVDTGSTTVETGTDSSVVVDSGPADTSTADTGSADSSGCDPSKGLTISCGVGECTVTMAACSETGAPNTCKPKDPGTEVCDGKDNDCDGIVDEDLGQTECGVGECKTMQKNCVDGSPKTCMAKTPAVETCNGKDDDCDGTVDNGFPSTTCGVGECKNTVSACAGGMTMMCVPKPKSTEVCNGKDDDCDGTVDNDIAPITCGTGICANTVVGCTGGIPTACVPKDLGVESCGTGECVNIISTCIGGVPQTCSPKPPSVESCNGKDDNCDGTPDNADPAIMCPKTANVALTSCSAATCRIATCDAGWADPDRVFSNGCECADSTTPHVCPGADFGTVAVGTERTFTSNNPVAGRDDWIKITFLDARSNKLATPRIKLTMAAPWSGPIPFDIEVQQNACGGTRPDCLSEGGTAIARTEWDTKYTAAASGAYGDALWIPILTGAGVNAVVYVRIGYKAGATATPTCSNYILTIGN